jgi:D-glycero-alpha-D-manno-heptose 1-phosphate guanylyltransferase
MALVNGRPFLTHLLDYWLVQGVDHFVLSVGYLHDMILNFIGARYRGVSVDYAVEETPLGTGGGLLLALDRLRDDAPFLLLNGDTFFAVQADSLLGFHNRQAAAWTLSLFHATEANRYMGVKLGDDGRIEDLASGKGEVGAYANGGVYAASPGALRQCGFPAASRLSLENEMLPQIQDKGQRIYGITYSATFIDIGVPADYERAQDILP